MRVRPTVSTGAALGAVSLAVLPVVAAVLVAPWGLGSSSTNFLWAVVTATATVVALVGARVSGLLSRWLLTGGLACVATGDLVWALVGLGGPIGDASLADAFYPFGYLFLAAALLLEVGRTSTSVWDVDALLDAATTVVVVALGLWFVETGHVYQDEPSDVGGFLTLAYPVLDALLVGLLFRLVLTRRVSGWRWSALVAGVACVLVADIGYLLSFSPGVFSVLSNGGWMIGCLLAAQWSLAAPARTRDRSPYRHLGGELAMAVVPLLLAVGVGVAGVVRGSWDASDAAVQGGATAILLVFAFVRTARLLHRESQALAALAGERMVSEAKSQAVAAVSHEIRTPMTGVLGYTELLLGSDLTAQQQELAERAYRAGRRLLDTVNGILDHARLKAGATQVERQVFDLSALVEDVVDLVSRPALPTGVELEVVIDPAVPRQVTTDPNLLRQVLINLVGNALKFTERGRVELRVSATGAAGSALTFQVSDTGIGMTPAQLRTVFEPFTQATDQTARRFGGSGLGLWISRSLVQAIGGQLTARSTPGVGTTFELTVGGAVAPDGFETGPGLRGEPARTLRASSG